MNRKIKQLNAFSGHSPLLCGDGGHSPLLNGDEGAQGSPCLVKRGFTLAEAYIIVDILGYNLEFVEKKRLKRHS